MFYQYHFLIILLLIISNSSSLNDRGKNVVDGIKTKNITARSDVAVIDSISDCICVTTENCNHGRDLTEEYDKISNGEGFLDIRFDLDTCKNHFEICCYDPITEELSQPSNPPKACGVGGDGINYRITRDGTNIQFGELPWTVMVLQEKESKIIYKCGGSLIHPQAVLTAAHCVDKMYSWSIRAGEWDTRTEDEMLPHQDRSVKEVILNPKYHKGSLRNDLALLILNEPVSLSENVNVVCLPDRQQKIDYFQVGRCVASGWGKDAFKKGNYSSILKKVDLPLVPKDDCVKALRTTRLGPYYQLDKSFICAGGEKNRDTCKGDGGSPLVCSVSDQPGRYEQLGIVSWGIGCGDKTPGVYTNVINFVEWIDEELLIRGFDIDIYKYS